MWNTPYIADIIEENKDENFKIILRIRKISMNFLKFA